MRDIDRVRRAIARRNSNYDVWNTLYGYVCAISLAYVCTMGILSMHNGMEKMLSVERYSVSQELVNRVAEDAEKVFRANEATGETVELPIVSITDSYVSPFGATKFEVSRDLEFEDVSEDLSRADILAEIYKPEVIDERIEALLDADGTIVVENNPFGKINGATGIYYDLSDAEITQIARLCTQEQGYSVDGVQAEASLMLNRYEKHGSEYSSLMSYIRNSGWWSNSDYYMDNGKTTDELVEAVREVVNGDRFFPANVDEHDCLRDIISVSNNGVEFDVYDKSQYISGVTKIRNRYHSVYTFYTFPTEKSDPFGMIEA